MCRSILILVIAILIALYSPFSVQAQSNPALQQGIQPFQSYDGGNLDSINLETGLLTLHIPVVSFPQRGALHLDYSVQYTNPIVTVSSVLGHWYQQVSPLLSIYFTNDAFPLVNYTATNACGGGNVGSAAYCTYYTLTLIEGDGTGHPVGFINSTATQARSLDGTGFFVSSPLASSCSVTDRSGVTTAWNGSVATATDSNGNQMTGVSNAAAGCYNADAGTPYFSSGAVTDSMGRQIPNFSPLSWGSTGSDTWIVPGPNGGTATYQFTASASEQSIVLPDLTAYTFVFETLSLPILNPQQAVANTLRVLKSISLPSGGSISYGYQLPAGTEANGSPVIISRTVKANDGTGPHTWTYSYGSANYNPSTNLSNPVTTVTDPLGDVSIHTFSPYGPYETELQEEDSSGNLLKTTQTSYGDVTFNGGPPYLNFNPTSITTIWPNGQQNTVSMTYDIDHGSGFIAGQYSVWPNGPIFSANSYSSSYTSNRWSTTETDYGNGASGAVLRKTVTNYLAASNATYLANNLLDLPSSVQVQDGGGTQRAYTTYGYDESILQASGVTTQKVAGKSYPGNQTSVRRWLTNGNAAAQAPCNMSVASGGYLATNNVYYDSGKVQKTTDPCLYPTSYLYSAAYDGAYPTTVTNSMGQQTTIGYDFNTGLQTSVTDPNSRVISTAYDIMGRPTGVTYPDEGSTSYCYTDLGGATCSQVSAPPYSIVTTQAISSLPTVSKTSTSSFDGLGRVSETQLNSDPAGITTVKTTYDALGRTYTISNPYRSTSDSTYGLTTYFYDALGRMVKTVQPDGSIAQTCYNGFASPIALVNCSSHLGRVATGTWIDSTDENGNHWQRTTDALGRLSEVMEPNGTAQTPTMETDYGYDALNDLTSVTQWGGPSGSTGSKTRSFSYDSLSRLITSANPETGTICYGVWNSTNQCSSGYDANGNLVARTDARGVVTSSAYDGLNRLLSKTYSGTNSSASAIAAVTLPTTYVYDGSTVTNGIGRLATEYTGPAATPVSQTSIQVYDPMGRVKQETTVAPNVSSTVLASFDLAGHRIALTYPDGRTVQDGFDSAGRLNSSATTSFGGNPVTQAYVNPQQIAYDAAGHVIGADYGNGTQYFAAYDNRERVTTMTYGPPGPLWSKQYAWTANSNLQSQTDLVTGVQRQYNYDNLNRLTAAQDIYSSLAVSSTANGNTTSTSTSGSGAEETPGGTGALPEWTDPYDSNVLGEIGETDWVASSSVTMTTNAAAAPDGTSTAAQVMASSSASGASSIYIQGSIATPSAYSLETMAGSVWLKSADSTSPTINLYLMANGAAAASKQVQLSQSWQQVGLSASMPDNLTSLYFEIGGGGTISAGHGVQVWNAMLEDHGIAGSSITNYLPYSQLPTASTWSAYGSGIAVNSASAPDGSQTASTVSQPRAATGFYLQDSVTNPAPANQQQITGSIFLQAVSGSISLTVSIQETSGGTATQCGATPVTLTTAWQRIRVNCTAQNALSVLTLLINGAPVDRSFSFNLWGAQLELASTAGPYVATDSIPATNETTLTNLLPYSEQLGYTGWQNAQNTVSATRVAAPDGSLTASQISQAAGNTQMSDVTPTPELADGLTVTGSVYLKWVSGPTTATLNLYVASSAGAQALGVQTVTLTSTWQRFQTTVALPSGLTALGIGFGGTPNQTYQAWGAQLEIASHAGPYVETSALPIITGSEPTNILPNSQSLSGQNWVPFSSATTVTPNYAAAPDGTTTAALLQASSSSTDSGIKVGVPNPSLYDGETVTASVYLRSLSATQHVNLYLQNIGATGSTAPASAGVNATTTWQRFDLTATLENGNTSISLQIGGGGSISLGQSIEIWGAQFVIGSAPAPYTPTPSATTVWATGTPGTLVQTGLNQAYSYDSFGNITQNGSFSTSYTANNQMLGYAYDATGNLLSDGINIMTWDAENRMATAAGATYIYDAEGNRVEKQGSAVMDTIYFGGQPIARYSGGQWTDLIYGPNGLLAEVPGTQNGVPLYRATDYEGTIVGSLLANGNFVDPIDHTPFGQVFTGNTSDPYLFTGKERDAESGLDYFGARYMSSSMGRFSSPDPSGLHYADPTNPQSLNLYSYVMNRPLVFVDPNGLCGGPDDDDFYGCNVSLGGGKGYLLDQDNNRYDYSNQASVTVTANDNNPRDDSSSGIVTSTITIPLNGVPTPVTYTQTWNNPGAKGQPDATQLPSCYKIEADVVVGDLNPFSPGWSTATGLAGDAAATGSAYKATQAAIYAGTKINTKGGIGLISPLKSSTYRDMMAESKLLGETSGVLFWGSLDVSLGRASYAAVTTPCK